MGRLQNGRKLQVTHWSWKFSSALLTLCGLSSQSTCESLLLLPLIWHRDLFTQPTSLLLQTEIQYFNNVFFYYYSYCKWQRSTFSFFVGCFCCQELFLVQSSSLWTEANRETPQSNFFAFDRGHQTQYPPGFWPRLLHSGSSSSCRSPNMMKLLRERERETLALQEYLNIFESRKNINYNH